MFGRNAPLAIIALAFFSTSAFAGDDALVIYKSLSPEVALEAAQAAMKKCRDNGFQVAVAVVDRFGQPQVMLRDRYAGLPGQCHRQHVPLRVSEILRAWRRCG